MDLLIGAIDLLPWNQAKVWVESAKASGFTGDIAIIGYRVSQDFVDEAGKAGVKVLLAKNFAGKEIHHAAGNLHTQVHQLRFYHVWEYLIQNPHYRYVILTDVRDVVFQLNPMEWVEAHSFPSLIAPSEGILYKDEYWNTQNFVQAFGVDVWKNAMQNKKVYNIGTIAGTNTFLQDFCPMLFQMTQNKPQPSDQAAFNLLLQTIYADRYTEGNHQNGWCCQCGVTLDPHKLELREKNLDPLPVVEDGSVRTADGKLFTIVHQYDRVPELSQEIRKKYHVIL